MKRGLYVRAGDCATARLAACAISLFGPTTNDSKLFLGLSPSALLVCPPSRGFSTANSLPGISGRLASLSPSEAEENFIFRGVPKAVTMADCNAVIWLLSIQN